MYSAAWWYSGITETYLLLEIVTEGSLSVTLGELTSSAAGQVQISGNSSQMLGFLVGSAVAGISTSGELNLQLGSLTSVGVGVKELFFIFPEVVENDPEPVIDRNNDYVGVLIIHDSKYGEESIIYAKEDPDLYMPDPSGMIFNKTSPINLTGGHILSPGNWRHLFKVK